MISEKWFKFSENINTVSTYLLILFRGLLTFSQTGQLGPLVSEQACEAFTPSRSSNKNNVVILEECNLIRIYTTVPWKFLKSLSTFT